MKRVVICLMISSLFIVGGCSSNTKTGTTSSKLSDKVATDSSDTSSSKTGTVTSTDSSQSSSTGSKASSLEDDSSAVTQSKSTSSSNRKSIDAQYTNYASGVQKVATVENGKLIMHTRKGARLEYSLEILDDLQRSDMVRYIRSTQTSLAYLKKNVDAGTLSLGTGYNEMAAAEKADIAYMTNPELTYVGAKYSNAWANAVKAKTLLVELFENPFSESAAEDNYTNAVALFKQVCTDMNITSITF